MTLFHALGPISSSLAQGDLEFITSATGSATSAINVNNCFSAAYDHYLVMRNLLGSAADNKVNIRLRSGSTDETGANYRHQYIFAASTSISSFRSTGLTSWEEGLGYTETTSIGFAQTWISNPFAAVRTTAWCNVGYQQTSTISALSQVHEHDLTTSYDGFSVIPSAGTLTGTVYVYGLKV